MVLLGLLLGLVLGASAAWLLARAHRSGDLRALEVELAHERADSSEKLALLTGAREELKTQLAAMCSEALQGNTTQFMELAKTQFEKLQVTATHDLETRQKAVEHLVAPIRESLDKVDGKIRDMEKVRTEAYVSLSEQVRSLAQGQRELRTETGNLVTALRSPHVRGRWGEMQLRRVVEAAGMLAHCDFAEQTTLSADGKLSRPDLIVKLAGGKQVIVDAKAPLQAYLEAIEAQTDEARAERFRAHARQIKDHVAKLSAKGYWTQLDATPEFVVMFIPGEPFYGAALEHDPTLIEEAAKRQVILATPTTLIAVLWAVAHGWREERLAENAREISELGSDLYRRLCTLGDHVAKVGRSLGTAVGAYNELAGSLESRVFPSARRFRELGAAPIGDLKPLTMLDHTVRPSTAPELLPAPVADADAA